MAKGVIYVKVALYLNQDVCNAIAEEIINEMD